MISVQLLDRLTGRAYGTRLQGYLCTLRRYVRNVDVAGDLSISPNKAGGQLFIAAFAQVTTVLCLFTRGMCVEP